jgi:hypothetical protein
MPADAKAALVVRDDCVSALLHAMRRERSSGGDDLANAELCGSCEALNALIAGLPKQVKRSLLSGEKGVVDALLRVLADAKHKAAWGFVGFCFRNMFLDGAAEERLQLLSDGRGIIEAIVGVVQGDEASAWAGACGALNSFLFNLPASAKQLLLNGEKGVVRGLLRVLGDSKGKAAWDFASKCFWNMFIGASAVCKEALLSDGRGIVEAIVGVVQGDEASAWAGACGALNSFLSDLSASAKQAFFNGEKIVLLASAVIAHLDSEDAHSCWGGSMELLKRLAYQEASLSHINFCTLDFLKKDSGLMAVLLRCSRGFSTDSDNKAFHSVCSSFVQLSSTSSNPPFCCVSFELLTFLVAAVQLCSYQPALRSFGLAMSNFGENVAFCSVLAQAKVHQYALSKIAGISPADDVWNDPYSFETCMLSVIVNMSRNEMLHVELKQFCVIEVLTPLACQSCAAELRVLMAMSYIIGCKESTGGGSLALAQIANSDSIGKIIDCLENTLNLRGGPGYCFGFILLPAILQVVRMKAKC